MNEPIVVVNETIELINYNFLDISSFKPPHVSVVKRIIFVQILGDEFKEHYDYNSGHKFHRNMIEAINLMPSVTEIVIENYPWLSDDHFKFLLVFRWESLTKISLTRCGMIGQKFFRWVSNNCRKLKHFEMTCHYRMDPIYQNQNEYLEKYFYLDSGDLVSFFDKNFQTLETLQLQLTTLDRAIYGEGDLNDFIDRIRTCSNLHKLCLFVEDSYDYEVAHALAVLFSAKFTFFQFLVGKFTFIKFDILEPSGDLEVWNRPSSSGGDATTTTGLMNANLREVLSIHSGRVSHVTLSNIVDLSADVLAVLGTNANNTLNCLKLLNCGTVFGREDIEHVVQRCDRLLKFVVVTEGSESFGETNISLLDKRVVCAFQQSGQLKWNFSDVKHHKKTLDYDNYVWLINECDGKVYDSESEDEDN